MPFGQKLVSCFFSLLIPYKVFFLSLTHSKTCISRFHLLSLFNLLVLFNIYAWLLAEFDKLYLPGPSLHLVVNFSTWHDMTWHGYGMIARLNIFGKLPTLGHGCSVPTLLSKYICIWCLISSLSHCVLTNWYFFLLLGVLWVNFMILSSLWHIGILVWYLWFGIISWSFATWGLWSSELLIWYFLYYVFMFELFWFIT